LSGSPQQGGLVVPDGITLLIGGARSGKSALAVRLGESFVGPVTFAATATPGDEEMAARIERHQDERPHAWATLESPFLEGTLPNTGLLIVDCVTLWVANVMFASGADSAPQNFEHDLADRTTALLKSLRLRTGPTVIVTNEVGLGIVPDTPLSRTYRDALGRVNTQLAAGSDRALFVSAGRIFPLLSINEVFQ
jgi:adenosylcobinamide kinase / adenosylcobinamide-phosphate guanylyltransferase